MAFCGILKDLLDKLLFASNETCRLVQALVSN